MSDGMFKHDSLQDRKSIQNYLEVLQKGFASGALKLRMGERVLEIEPGEIVEFTLEAKKKGDRRKLTLKFTWKDEDSDAQEDEQLIMEAE